MLLPSIFDEDLFDDWMNFPFDDRFEKRLNKELYGRKNPVFGKNAARIMRTDVKEKKDSYEVDIDLPGFKKEQIQIQLENGYLTISAQKGLDKDEEKEGKYIRRERFSGSCRRSFYVGENVEQSDIKACFKHGILRLTIPKKEETPKVEENKYISIEG